MSKRVIPISSLHLHIQTYVVPSGHKPTPNLWCHVCFSCSSVFHLAYFTLTTQLLHTCYDM